MKSLLYTIFLFAICTSSVLAQDASFEISQHFLINKMPVNAIVIDYSNNKWIGTENGLYKIDGLETIAKKVKNQSVAAAIFGENERGWIASYDNKIQLFEKQFNYTTNVPSNEMITSIDVNGNNFWIGSTNGLYRISLKSKKENQSFFVKNSKLPSNRINEVFVDGFDHKWIATEEGLVQMYKKMWKTHLKKKNVTALEFHKNALYAACDGEMWRFKNNQWEELTLPDEMKTSPIEDMVFDKNDNLWLACGVLGRIDKNWFPYVYGEADDFLSNHPTSLAIDLKGNIWVGTAGNGLFKVRTTDFTDSQPIAFASLDNNIPPPIDLYENSLKGGDISAVTTNLVDNKLVKTGKIITTDKRRVKIALWDASSDSNDRITVFYNGRKVLKKYKLSKKRKVISLRVKASKINQLMIVAHTEDSKTIKTVKVAMLDKDEPQHWMTLTADAKFCDEIKFEHVK